ncbi:hypothetical protein NST02_03620 [Robertmurraya sp. FSL W8-0741]|uniref:hypothetical protein n=1 Tax=Robertmurraya sp. FSL W8-0741 TaxID=2954629 RepID=UPI0030FA181E
MAFYFFIALTAICLIVTLRKKKTIFLVIPFLSIIVYFIIQVALVPLPFIETLKFIFSLN